MRGTDKLFPPVAAAAELLAQHASTLKLRIQITDTLRTNAEQRALYAHSREPADKVNALRKAAGMPAVAPAEAAAWRTDASDATRSYHGYGLAFDWVLLDAQGRASYDTKADTNMDGQKDWYQVAGLTRFIPGLESGAYWSSKPDLPHCQMTFGLTPADLRAGHRPPGWKEWVLAARPPIDIQ
ncbi:M15 family metallopeptidase [uncultured Ramlibacter sp.]|uniref:M15 family metallopeptidase n=1 Tax=uncultured Ramlibacter sp. TaxID=260755 RepID=UPI00260C80BF|nr:M15 family metallopeptidase [uncultured Ramlibacter sp.]